MASLTPTPWAVRCPEHGKVFLTRSEYDRQMDSPNAHWYCTSDHFEAKAAWWDDNNYDEWTADQETYDAMVLLHGDPDVEG